MKSFWNYQLQSFTVSSRKAFQKIRTAANFLLGLKNQSSSSAFVPVLWAWSIVRIQACVKAKHFKFSSAAKEGRTIRLKVQRQAAASLTKEEQKWDTESAIYRPVLAEVRLRSESEATVTTRAWLWQTTEAVRVAATYLQNRGWFVGGLCGGNCWFQTGSSFCPCICSDGDPGMFGHSPNRSSAFFQ